MYFKHSFTLKNTHTHHSNILYISVYIGQNFGINSNVLLGPYIRIYIMCLYVVCLQIFSLKISNICALHTNKLRGQIFGYIEIGIGSWDWNTHGRSIRFFLPFVQPSSFSFSISEFGNIYITTSIDLYATQSQSSHSNPKIYIYYISPFNFFSSPSSSSLK